MKRRRSFPSWRMGRDEISLLGELVQLLVKSSPVVLSDNPGFGDDYGRTSMDIPKATNYFRSAENPIERDKVRLVLSPFWLKIGQCPPECDKKDLMHAIEYSIFRGVIRLEVKGEFCYLRV
ncbi:hypothetical protein Gohar_008419 [Gossypium harknessii]|uniref:Uncharacterized protein n=1 Tax=Gossypium harknessii TaxID=34285 RepID=A0A7J9GJL8_9ROSI|nr:hypothetical protein [Gossypium harknessii]